MRSKFSGRLVTCPTPTKKNALGLNREEAETAILASFDPAQRTTFSNRPNSGCKAPRPSCNSELTFGRLGLSEEQVLKKTHRSSRRKASL